MLEERDGSAGDTARCGPRERLEVSRIDSAIVLKIVQEDIVHGLFGGASPPDREIFASFRKNSRRSVALYSLTEKAFVGFASIWPIRSDIAQKIMTGKMREDQLRGRHILPDRLNSSALYAIVPGMGVLAADERSKDARAFRLLLGFRTFIRKEFFDDAARRMTILATAYTEDGARWCHALDMQRTFKGAGASRVSHDVYAREFSSKDFKRLQLKIVGDDERLQIEKQSVVRRRYKILMDNANYLEWVKSYHRWYLKAVRTWGVMLFVCRTMTLASTLTAAVLAAQLGSDVKVVKWVIVGAALLGTASSTLMAEFKIDRMLSLRERGRLEAADIVARVRDKLEEYANEQDKLYALKDDTRERIRTMELNQGRRFEDELSGRDTPLPERRQTHS